MSYFKCYEQSIIDTIKQRVSCRTYTDDLLQDSHKERLIEFSKVVDRGLQDEPLRFHLCEYTVEELKEKKIAEYGLFKNARSFIVGVIEGSDFCQVSFGYCMEYVVLKATEIGLGTCWIGYYHQDIIKTVQIGENECIPCICMVGYPSASRSFRERAARLVMRASSRKAWKDLFYSGDFETALTRDAAGSYCEPLEMLRLAPSAGNTQPWRIVKENDKHVYHFFKKIVSNRFEKRKLHDVDIGIAMCHYELAAAANNLQGIWEIKDSGIKNLPPKTHYIISWRSE